MKNFAYSIILLFFLFTVASCEKDDICVEGTTPLMVIEFYDANSRETLKNVTSLRVGGVGQEFTVNTVADRTNLSTVTIPLKTVEDITSFVFISNSATNEDNVQVGNIDTVTFNYSRLEDFKSRACGFIVTYEELTGTLQTDTDNWIQEIEIIQSEIITSDSTHVKIYH